MTGKKIFVVVKEKNFFSEPLPWLEAGLWTCHMSQVACSEIRLGSEKGKSSWRTPCAFHALLLWLEVNDRANVKFALRLAGRPAVGGSPCSWRVAL